MNIRTAPRVNLIEHRICSTTLRSNINGPSITTWRDTLVSTANLNILILKLLCLEYTLGLPPGIMHEPIEIHSLIKLVSISITLFLVLRLKRSLLAKLGHGCEAWVEGFAFGQCFHHIVLVLVTINHVATIESILVCAQLIVFFESILLLLLQRLLIKYILNLIKINSLILIPERRSVPNSVRNLLLRFLLHHLQIVSLIMANIIRIVKTSLNKSVWRARIFANGSNTCLFLLINRWEYIMWVLYWSVEAIFDWQTCQLTLRKRSLRMLHSVANYGVICGPCQQHFLFFVQIGCILFRG